MADKHKPGKNQPSGKHDHSPSDKETTKRHVYVEPGVEIDLVQDFRDEYRANQTANTTHNQRQLLWTIISAILIFIYAGLTGWQGCSTKRAADAARDTAKMASDTLKATTLNFRIEQRPYMTVDSMKIVNSTTGDKNQDALRVVFFNVGRTPAAHFRIDPDSIEVLIQDAPPLRAYTIGISKSVVGPDKVETFDFPLNLNQPFRSEIHDGKRKLWFKGSALYEDVFGCSHKTTFCSEYRKDGFRNCAETDGVNEFDSTYICDH